MGKLFIKDQEFHDCIAGEKNIDLATVEPRIDDVCDRFIVPITGRDHLNALTDLIDSETGLSVVQKRAIELTRKAVAHLSMALSTDDLDVKAATGGFTVSNGTDVSVASGERVRRYMENRSKDGQRYIDMMIDHLESNADDFEEYRDSDERKSIHSNFINTTDQLKKYLVPAPGRFVLDRMRPIITSVEMDQLIPMIGQDLFDHLKELISERNTVPVNFGVYAPLIGHIESAIANLAMAESIESLNLNIDEINGVYISFYKNANEPRQSQSAQNINTHKALFTNRAMKALERLKTELTTNAEDYTLYYESSAYTAPESTENYLKADDTQLGSSHFGF